MYLKHTTILLLSFFILLFTACGGGSDGDSSPTTNNSQRLTFGNFGITEKTYDHTSDWEEAVLKEFGSEYEVADWDEFNHYYSEDLSLDLLLNGLGLKNYKDTAFILNNGKKEYSNDRAYFISRHNRNKPDYYLTHDHIDDYYISLGSGSGKYKIITMKKNFNTPTTGEADFEGSYYGSFDGDSNGKFEMNINDKGIISAHAKTTTGTSYYLTTQINKDGTFSATLQGYTGTKVTGQVKSDFSVVGVWEDRSYNLSGNFKSGY